MKVQLLTAVVAVFSAVTSYAAPAPDPLQVEINVNVPETDSVKTVKLYFTTGKPDQNEILTLPLNGKFVKLKNQHRRYNQVTLFSKAYCVATTREWIPGNITVVNSGRVETSVDVKPAAPFQGARCDYLYQHDEEPEEQDL